MTAFAIDNVLNQGTQDSRIELILQGLAENLMTLLNADGPDGREHLVMCCDDPTIGYVLILDEDRDFLIKNELIQFHRTN